MMPTSDDLYKVYEASGCKGLVSWQLAFYETNKKEKEIVPMMQTLGAACSQIVAHKQMSIFTKELTEFKARLTGAP